MSDAIEAVANAAFGMAISAAAVHLLWPLFGWQASGAQSLAVAGVFFVLSTARAYALRRLFRALEARG
jgi:hypothetical protein